MALLISTVVMLQAQNRETINGTWKVAVSIMTTSVTRLFHNTSDLQDQDEDRFFGLRPVLSQTDSLKRRHWFLWCVVLSVTAVAVLSHRVNWVSHTMNSWLTAWLLSTLWLPSSLQPLSYCSKHWSPTVTDRLCLPAHNDDDDDVVTTTTTTTSS